MLENLILRLYDYLMGKEVVRLEEKFIAKSFTLTESILDRIHDVQFLTRNTNTSAVIREALIKGLNQIEGEIKKDGK